MIHNLFWQKWQGHGPFENLMKDTAIDSAVLAALQPVFLLGGRAEFSRRHSPPPPAMISPLPGDWWTEQGHTRHPWPGLGFLRVRARLGDCGRVASTTAQPWASGAWRLTLQSAGWFVAVPCFPGLLCERAVQACTLSLSLWNTIFFHLSEWSWWPLLAVKNSNW